MFDYRESMAGENRYNTLKVPLWSDANNIRIILR